MQRESKKTECLEVRVAPETKSAFMAACRSEGLSASGVLRRFIEQYLHSASRAPDPDAKELAMNYVPRRRALAAALAGTVAAGTAWVAVPAQAAVDPRMAAVFEWLDTSRDGRLTAGELEGTANEAPSTGAIELTLDTRTPPAPDETRAAMFSRLDSNADGAITLAELDAAAIVRTVATPEISAADANRDGQLTEGELAAYLTARRAAAGRANPVAGVGLLARGIITAHDRDGDGRVPVIDLLR